MKHLLFIVILLAVVSAACDKSGANTNSQTATNSNSVTTNKSPETTANSGKTNYSKKLDACEVLPKAEVEKILAQTVKSADLSRVTEGTEATAAFSQCTYQTANGQTVEFFARRSPIPDNSKEAIQKSRDTMSSIGKPEDVSGIGDTAFWVSKINQLHVFSDGNIYVYFTMRNFKDVGEAKTKAVELANQALKTLSSK